MQFKQVDNPRGNEIKIAGQKWVFAPAPLGAIERFQDQLNSPSVPAAVIIDLSHICLKRNYPDITREYVADELIDIGNMQEVLDLVVNVSGLDHKGDKEAADSGE